MTEEEEEEEEERGRRRSQLVKRQEGGGGGSVSEASQQFDRRVSSEINETESLANLAEPDTTKLAPVEKSVAPKNKNGSKTLSKQNNGRETVERGSRSKTVEERRKGDSTTAASQKERDRRENVRDQKEAQQGQMLARV